MRPRRRPITTPGMEPELELKRWTRLEYDRLVEQEFITRDDRIELIDWHHVVAEPQRQIVGHTVKNTASPIRLHIGGLLGLQSWASVGMT